MKEIVLDTLKDTIRIIPFLFIAFLIIEFIEHKLSKKNKKVLLKSRQYGPLLGGLLGMFPQCGFSALATNLFSSRVITLGTLIAVYLSTSDEMLPLLLTGGISFTYALKLVFLKALIGIFYGFIIDLIIRKQDLKEDDIKELCHDEHCHCEENILIGALKHTLNIVFFIFIASLCIAYFVHYMQEENIENYLLQGSILSYPIASLIGLIPNCASSVIVTEFYLKDFITLGNLFSALLTGAGVGLLVLFRTNKNLKENLLTVGLIFVLGTVTGYIIDLVGKLL